MARRRPRPKVKDTGPGSAYKLDDIAVPLEKHEVLHAISWIRQRGDRVKQGAELATLTYQPSAGGSSDGLATQKKVLAQCNGSIEEIYAIHASDASGPSAERRTVVLGKIAVCTHPYLRDGRMCAVCGEVAPELAAKVGSQRVFVAGGHHVSVNKSEADSLHRAMFLKLSAARQLNLILDIDLTLLHATIDARAEVLAGDDVHSFAILNQGRMLQHWCRLRPGVREFLQKACTLYRLTIYTHGRRDYAHQVAKLLDPTRTLFADRIVSRDDCLDLQGQKSLARLFPGGIEMALIVDDSPHVWQGEQQRHLLQVMPFRFYTDFAELNQVPLSSPAPDQAAGAPTTSPDTSVKNFCDPKQDDQLRHIWRVLQEVHRLYYPPDPSLPSLDCPMGKFPAASLPVMGGNNIKPTQSNLEPAVVSEMQRHEAGEDSASQKAALVKESASEPVNGAGRTEHADNVLQSPHKIDTSTSRAAQIPTSATVHESSESTSLPHSQPPQGPILESAYTTGQVSDGNAALPVSNVKALLNPRVPVRPQNVADFLSLYRRSILAGCVLVFSGVLPRGIDPRRTDVGYMTEVLGAKITDQVSAETTHVVAENPQTEKVYMASRRTGDERVWIVTKLWLLLGFLHCERKKEEDYLLTLPETFIKANSKEKIKGDARKRMDRKRKLDGPGRRVIDDGQGTHADLEGPTGREEEMAKHEPDEAFLISSDAGLEGRVEGGIVDGMAKPIRRLGPGHGSEEGQETQMCNTMQQTNDRQTAYRSADQGEDEQDRLAQLLEDDLM